jgi:hypothetical protein
MMQRVWKILGAVVLWCAVAGFVLVFHKRSEQHDATTLVQGLDVIITDSLPDETLVSHSLVTQWVEQSKIPIIGEPVAKVDLAGVENVIRRNGFIERANAYTTHDGVLHLVVSQRKPLLRLLVDGYDCYLTREGFAFPAPRRSSVYAPVVTGEYRPPLERGYVGYVGDYIEGLIKESNERIAELQHSKKPLFDREKEIKDSVRAVRRMKVAKKGWIRYQGWFESDDAFEKRVRAKKIEKAALYRRYNFWRRENAKKIDAVTAKQNLERTKQKKLLKRYEDFLKLINFVKYIEEDSFWRAEIVQIVASAMSNGGLELELIPRTGTHRVLFGEVCDSKLVEDKLDRLLLFYQNGLTNLGWDTFSTISVQYEGQVVCAK